MGCSSDKPAPQGWGFLISYASYACLDGWQGTPQNSATGVLVIVAGVHESYWKTVAVFGVGLAQSRPGRISNIKPEIPYRRQVAFERTAALVGGFCCISSAGDVAVLRMEIQMATTSVGWYRSLGWGEQSTADRYFSTFIPVVYIFCNSHVKLDLLNSSKVLLLHASKLWYDIE